MLHDLWLAGQGTTATTLYVGFMKLVNHPGIIQNIQKELLDITENGARDLTLKDRPNTPYLNATIAEIQRHASILNVNFWRINHETIHFNDYQVDPGTMIAAQVGVLHVNEELFDNPKDFNVEKYLKNPKLLQQVIPFGIGKRSCVGEQIAKSELYLVGVVKIRNSVEGRKFMRACLRAYHNFGKVEVGEMYPEANIGGERSWSASLLDIQGTRKTADIIGAAQINFGIAAACFLSLTCVYV